MGNWKVGVRLALGFALLLLLMVAAVAVSLLGLRDTVEQASRLERENVVLLQAAHRMRVAQLTDAVAVRDFVSLPDVESQRDALRTMQGSDKAYAEASEALAQTAAAMGNGALAAQAVELRQQA